MAQHVLHHFGMHAETEQVCRGGMATGAALLVLLVTTTLSIYEPEGSTSYGRQKRRQWRAVYLP